MSNYSNLINNSEYILLGRELHKEHLTAVYMYDRVKKVKIRVDIGRMLNLAKTGHIVNCTFDNGKLVGLHCNLNELPIYDKDTGKIRYGSLSEELIVNRFESEINSCLVKAVEKYKDDEIVVGYLLKNLKSGQESKCSVEDTKEIASKGLVVNCSVCDNALIEQEDIQVIDVTEYGEYDLEKELEELGLKYDSEEDYNRSQEEIASKTRQAISYKYDIVKVIISRITKVPTSYIIRNISSLNEYEISVSDFERWADKVNPNITRAEKIYKNSRIEVENCVLDIYNEMKVSGDIRERISQIIDIDTFLELDSVEIEMLIKEAVIKIKNGTDFVVSGVTLELVDGTVRIVSILIERGNKSASIELDTYINMRLNNIVYGPDINDILDDPFNRDKKYKINIVNNSEIAFVVTDIVKDSISTDGKLKRLVINVVNSLGDRIFISLDTLHTLIDIEKEKMEKKDLNFLKNRYEHCISKVDMTKLKSKLMLNFKSTQDWIYWGRGNEISVEIVPFSGRDVHSKEMSHCIYNNIMYIGSKDNYSVIPSNSDWIELLAYLLIHLSLIYGSSMDVLVRYRNTIILDNTIKIENINTKKIRGILNERNIPLEELESVLYNHINAELIKQLGLNSKFKPSDKNMKPIYL